ncbi:MAG: glutamine amidotransferase [Steroidobacteraceae bacterium]
MRHTLIIQHVPFEDLGTLEPPLVQAGLRIDSLHAGLSDLSAIDPLAPDLLIVLGGPIGVYETDAYPQLRVELALIAQRLAARRPTLGICLGAQLMAAALGARVTPGNHGKEIGWAAVTPASATAQIPVLDALFRPGIRVLHWHGDTFELPAGAVHLAASTQYPQQAFALGRHGLALQFHAEIALRGLEAWYMGHAVELQQAKVSIPQLRVDGRRYAPALEQVAPALWRACLEYLGVTG